MVRNHGSQNPQQSRVDSPVPVPVPPWSDRGPWAVDEAWAERRVCPRCRQETVGSRVEACSRCGFSFLETQASEGPPVVPASDLVGRVINGKYRVLSLLGEGGFGIVYKVELLLFDTANTFALKLLHPSLSQDRTFRKRFLREAGLAMSLIHENTIQIREFGQTEDGHLFFTMDYCSGEPLKAVIQRERFLTVNRALPIVRQILSVMRLAHSRGIVHRDLKPENIFLERDASGRDFVKVGDFGLAKSFGPSEVPSGAVTPGRQTAPIREDITRGGIVGTPRYMSPEQALGREDIDGRSDIFSIGVVLYEMLYGQLPGGRDTPAPSRRSDGTVATIEAPPESPHRVPQAVWEIIRRATLWEREERYQSAQDFLDAIDALPEYAPTYTESSPVRKSSARSFFWIATLALAAGAALAVYRLGDRSRPSEPREASTDAKAQGIETVRALIPKVAKAEPAVEPGAAAATGARSAADGPAPSAPSGVRAFLGFSVGDVLRYQTYREGMVPDRELLYEIVEEPKPGRFVVKVTPGERTFAWVAEESENALYQEFALPDPATGELSEVIRRLKLSLPPGGVFGEDHVRDDLRVRANRVDLPVPGHPLYDVFRGCLCVESRDGARVRREYYQEGRGLVALLVLEPRPKATKDVRPAETLPGKVAADAARSAPAPAFVPADLPPSADPSVEHAVVYARYLIEGRSARPSSRGN